MGGNKAPQQGSTTNAALPMQDEATRPPIAEVPPHHFRRNVVAMVIDEQRRLLLCLRKDREGWQCVQGGVEAAEDDRLRTAARELYEEVGLHALDASGARVLSDEELGLTPTADATGASASDDRHTEHIDKRSPRREEPPSPPPVPRPAPTLKYVGRLPLLPHESPLRHWFPVGTCLSHVRRGIYGQQQECLVFASNNGDALIKLADLRGLLGQPREFIALRWHALVHDDDKDVAKLTACVPPCKVDVFATLHRALRRVFAVLDGASDSLPTDCDGFHAEVETFAAAYATAVRR